MENSRENEIATKTYKKYLKTLRKQVCFEKVFQDKASIRKKCWNNYKFSPFNFHATWFEKRRNLGQIFLILIFFSEYES